MNILLGIGNSMRGDDGAGPFLARMFRHEGWISVDGGTMPENFTSLLRREHPDLVVLVDAAEMGLAPGSFRRVPLDRITDLSLGTHASDLTTFILYIQSFVPEIVFIGIQPEEVRDLPSPSSTVKRGVKRLQKILRTEGVQGVPFLE